MSNQRLKTDWDAIGSDVIRLYISGNTAREIGDQFGISEGSVQQFLYKSNVHKRSALVMAAHAQGVENRSYSEQNCGICNGKFEPKSGNQKYCKTCIPNLSARKRFEAYGVADPEWQRLLDKQNGICKLCPEPATVLDHNHKSAEPRGLLCVACNTALNRMEIEGWNERAMAYLSDNLSLSVRDFWLIWRLIESLRSREIPFEGKDGEFAGDFDRLRDKCLDRAFDYKPEEG